MTSYSMEAPKRCLADIRFEKRPRRPQYPCIAHAVMHMTRTHARTRSKPQRPRSVPAHGDGVVMTISVRSGVMVRIEDFEEAVTVCVLLVTLHCGILQSSFMWCTHTLLCG